MGERCLNEDCFQLSHLSTPVYLDAGIVRIRMLHKSDMDSAVIWFFTPESALVSTRLMNEGQVVY